MHSFKTRCKYISATSRAQYEILTVPSVCPSSDHHKTRLYCYKARRPTPFPGADFPMPHIPRLQQHDLLTAPTHRIHVPRPSFLAWPCAIFCHPSVLSFIHSDTLPFSLCSFNSPLCSGFMNSDHQAFFLINFLPRLLSPLIHSPGDPGASHKRHSLETSVLSH